MVKKGKFWIVIIEVKKGQIWVVIVVIKKAQIRWLLR